MPGVNVRHSDFRINYSVVIVSPAFQPVILFSTCRAGRGSVYAAVGCYQAQTIGVLLAPRSQVQIDYSFIIYIFGCLFIVWLRHRKYLRMYIKGAPKQQLGFPTLFMLYSSYRPFYVSLWFNFRSRRLVRAPWAHPR